MLNERNKRKIKKTASRIRMNKMDDKLTQILKAHLCKPKSSSNQSNTVNIHSDTKTNSLHSILARQLKKPTSAPNSPSAGKSKSSKKEDDRNFKRTKSFKESTT